MARIQDIHNLEESICDAVEEYLDNTDGYRHPVLRVYYDKDLMLYCAEMDDNLEGSEDDGIYAIDRDDKVYEFDYEVDAMIPRPGFRAYNSEYMALKFREDDDMVVTELIRNGPYSY